MDSVDLIKLAEIKGVSSAELADVLFPGNKYPGKALKRVFSRESELTASQLSRLASHFDMPVGDLFTNGRWVGNKKGEVLTFTNDFFRAELDMASGVSRVFKKNTLLHETLIHSKTVTLSEYVHKLNILTK